MSAKVEPDTQSPMHFSIRIYKQHAVSLVSVKDLGICSNQHTHRVIKYYRSIAMQIRLGNAEACILYAQHFREDIICWQLPASHKSIQHTKLCTSHPMQGRG